MHIKLTLNKNAQVLKINACALEDLEKISISTCRSAENQCANIFDNFHNSQRLEADEDARFEAL